MTEIVSRDDHDNYLDSPPPPSSGFGHVLGNFLGGGQDLPPGVGPGTGT